MSTITPNKTPGIVVLAHQVAVHPITIVGSTISVVDVKRAVTLYMYHGFIQGAANSNPGKFKIQIRPDAGAGSVNEHWITVAQFVTTSGTPDVGDMTASEPIGETSLAVVSAAGFAAEDLLYIHDTTTLADSEWSECQEVSGTNILLLDGLTVAKDGADNIYNDASKFAYTLDLNSIEAYRVVWSHEGSTGADGHVQVLGSYHDSDNSA